MTTSEVDFEYYRPGLLFLSNAGNLQFFIGPAEFHTSPSGDREQIKPAIMAEFGDLTLQGGEFQDAEGVMRADVRGGAFDLDEAAAHYGWEDADKERVARKMLLALKDPSFRDFWLYEPPVPVAPWPNYEEMSESRVPQIAAELGLVKEALAYETATENRTKVVDALQEKADKLVDEDTFTEE